MVANRLYTKPLLLIMLGLYFYINTNRSRHSRTKSLVYTGLVFSWIGDLLLLKNDFIHQTNIDNYLMLGIVSYLICLVTYTIIFKKMNALNIRDCQEAFLAFLITSIGFIIYYRVLKMMPLHNFKYIIITAMFVMVLFAAFASNVYRNKLRKNIASKFLMPGALTFVIAISIIISHRFLLEDATFLPGVIVLTYGFGQMLIVRGFIKYLKA
jgi:uncharacterized membrane protein YhhN